MAVLSDADRQEIWAEFMREISAEREPISINKNDLRAFFNAADDWVNANAASFNAAIPQPARSGLTASQKARGLRFVVAKRFMTGA
jgi:hypothetical protein